jgi:hypothetical protein
MAGMTQQTVVRTEDRTEADGRTGLSTPFTGRRRRPMILLGIAVVGLCSLAALRHTAPAGPAPTTAAAHPEQQAPRIRYTPSPSAPPRGSLPKPDVVDQERNRLIGDLPEAGTAPGEQAAFTGVNQILNWYCPQSTAMNFSIDQVDGWNSVRVATRPQPGIKVELFLHWTGSMYRWQGPQDALERCW